MKVTGLALLGLMLLGYLTVEFARWKRSRQRNGEMLYPLSRLVLRTLAALILAGLLTGVLYLDLNGPEARRSISLLLGGLAILLIVLFLDVRQVHRQYQQLRRQRRQQLLDELRNLFPHDGDGER